MNCTLRRGWARRSADTAVLGTLLSIVSGCSTAEINASYEALKPRVVYILPVDNQTIHQLDKITFGGLLQRGTVGAEEYDIPGILRAAVEESVLLAGYSTAPGGGYAQIDWTRPLPEGQPAPPFDGVLVTTLESWWANTLGIPAFGMRFRVELRRVPTGEVLYQNETECRQEEDPRARSADMVPNAIRRAARRVLADLPPR
jgi:hypothetical protein